MGAMIRGMKGTAGAFAPCLWLDRSLPVVGFCCSCPSRYPFVLVRLCLQLHVQPRGGQRRPKVPRVPKAESNHETLFGSRWDDRARHCTLSSGAYLKYGGRRESEVARYHASMLPYGGRFEADNILACPNAPHHATKVAGHR